ncbi:MAG: radical SAM protein [Patescibacteria group bacterium]
MVNMKNRNKQRIFFATLGCRLNQAETEKLRTDALRRGFRIETKENEADIFVLNSCSVTDKAQKDTNKILKRLSSKYPDKERIITGCGARDEHKKYAVVVKNNEKENLFCHLERNEIEPRNPLKNVGNTIGERDFSAFAPMAIGESVEMTDNGRTRLMYKVQDGCNNRCSYCIVSYLRGRERSLEVNEIISELQAAQKRGFKEVVLCGVNVGKYHHTPSVIPVIDSEVSLIAQTRRAEAGIQSSRHPERNVVKPKDLNLASLIEKILKHTTFERIRLSSINPDDFSDDLIHLWAQNDRLCPHCHISLQSGSDTVLARMGRKYNTKQYSELVAKLRNKIPDVTITTDIIVGFPGETEEEFTETMKFVKKMNFLKIHVFRYSKREGTRAATMEGQIPEKTKKERAVKLQSLESEIRRKILKNYIGKEAEVLFEQGKNGLYSGFTSNYIKVLKKSQKDLTNQVTRVKIKDINKQGRLLSG